MNLYLSGHIPNACQTIKGHKIVQVPSSADLSITFIKNTSLSLDILLQHLEFCKKYPGTNFLIIRKIAETIEGHEVDTLCKYLERNNLRYGHTMQDLQNWIESKT